MPYRRFHTILSVPVFILLYAYTAVIVFLILIQAYLHWKAAFSEREKQIATRSFDAEIVLTNRHWHATELSKKYLELGCTPIIAVGGDGTMNEVSRPLINQKHVTTGLVPAGTGNDFIQILGFPDRFNEDLRDIFFKQHIIAMVPRGTHIHDEKVDYYKTDRLRIDFGKKVPFHVDGELAFDTIFDVSLLPLALNIIYNPNADHFFNLG